MNPSKSSLDRLPKQLSRCWEAERERFEAALRGEETVPPEAVTVAVSLDGVMVPMKEGGAHKSANRPRHKTNTPLIPRATRTWAVGR
jgi:hypothetical protein